MDGIFQSVGLDRPTVEAERNDDAIATYENMVKALIEDAGDYNDSDLSPERVDAVKYYEGLSPGLEDIDTDEEAIMGDPMAPDDDDGVNRSQAVSTDVRDTVLAILPSLIRIFTSAENVVYATASREDTVELAKQQTDGVNYTFWEENPGFLILHDIFKDALIQKVGIVKWWTETENEVRVKEFSNITIMQLSNMIQEYTQPDQAPPEVVTMTPSRVQEGVLEYVKVRYIESSPRYCVDTVPPEEFRIDRRARSVKNARLVGHQTLVTSSTLVSLGVPQEVVDDYRGKFDHYTEEADLRNPGIDTSWVQQDMVEWGEYFIRVDQDGDGIDELHYITVIGNNHDIVSDDIVDEVNMAVFCGDPRPHTVIGDSIADLTMDIQKINTQILRGSLDSLSGSMFSDFVVNEMVTNVEDVMSDGVGKIIRTRSDPNSAVVEFKKSFIGDAAFTMMGTMDTIRQRRTGISEASKGVDPKALQSTSVMGVDAIVTGAQERIELIARVFAETGFKDLFRGLMREMIRNPNKAKTVEMRGTWVDINPSLWDPNLRIRVNPTMGKGSDMNRLMALNEVKSTQLMIIEKFGIGNTIVTPAHFMNTITDILAIANIKDVSRYFASMTPEQIKAIQDAPKEPSPEELIAQSTIEEVKAKTAKAVSDRQMSEKKAVLDEDFRRDKLTLDTFAKIVPALAKVSMGTADTSLPTIESVNHVGP